MSRVSLFAWVLLAVALLAVGTVYYESNAILTEAATRASLASQTEQQHDRSAYSQRLHALVQDTQDERQSLDTFAQADIVSIVQLLQQTGKNAGVNVSVLNAVADGTGTDLQGGGTLQPIAFSLSADGSFSQLTHAAEMYERLPLASQILQIGIEKGDKNVWHLSMRIRVTAITTSSL